MGPEDGRRGPSFHYGEPPEPAAAISPRAPLRPGDALPVPRLADFQPTRSRWPGVLTGLVIAGVAAVTLVATAGEQREPATSAAAPVAAPVAGARGVAAASPNAIAISSPDGTGRLEVLHHSWTASGRASGDSALQVEVRLVCTSGRIDYDPYFFQAFDDRGRLYEVADAHSTSALGTGTLLPSRRVRGVLDFDMPRGAVTLMMTDGAAQALTALRIAG